MPRPVQPCAAASSAAMIAPSAMSFIRVRNPQGIAAPAGGEARRVK